MSTDLQTMIGAPLRKSKQCRPQGLAIWRETVFGMRLRTWQYGSPNNCTCFELPELFGQYLLGGARHASFEFLESQYAILQGEQDERFPFSTNHIDGGLYRAFLESHTGQFTRA